jgi:hypothetical protein
MAGITLKITTELLETLIIRRMAVVYGNDVDIAPARRLAQEYVAIADAWLALYAVRPPGPKPYPLPDEFVRDDPLPDEFVRDDFMFTLLTATLGWWPDDDSASEHSVWLYVQFDRVDGDELYLRWLKLSDEINDSDIASIAAG